MGQWSALTRLVVIGVGLVLIGWLLYTIRPMIAPLIIAVLLAYMLNPLVRLVQNRTRLSHKWAVPLVYFLALAVVVTIPSLLTPLAIGRVKNFLIRLVSIEAQLEALLDEPITFAGQQVQPGQLVADFLNATGQSLTSVAEGTRTVLEITSVSLLWLLVILVSVYYLLLDGERLRDWLVRLAPEADQPDVFRLLQQIDVIWRAYLRGTFVLMIVVGVVFTLAWLIIGVPGAIVLGVLTGIFTIIPDIGPAIAVLLAVLLAYFQGSNVLPLSNFWFAVVVFAVYFVLIQIKSIWLRPRVMKHFLHMNEGLIFVSIIGATLVWGILGALVIVPFLATLAVIGRYVRRRLLRLEPWPEDSPPAHSLEKASMATEPQPLFPSDASREVKGRQDGDTSVYVQPIANRVDDVGQGAANRQPG